MYAPVHANALAGDRFVKVEHYPEVVFSVTEDRWYLAYSIRMAYSHNDFQYMCVYINYFIEHAYKKFDFYVMHVMFLTIYIVNIYSV